MAPGGEGRGVAQGHSANDRDLNPGLRPLMLLLANRAIIMSNPERGRDLFVPCTGGDTEAPFIKVLQRVGQKMMGGTSWERHPRH